MLDIFLGVVLAILFVTFLPLILVFIYKIITLPFVIIRYLWEKLK